MKKITSSEITQKKVWESFVLSYVGANFLSSWNWGVFHQKLNKKVFYRGYYQGTVLVGVSLFVLEEAKRGRYLTVAGGPLLDWSNKELVATWKGDLTQLAKQKQALFVRVRPQLLEDSKNISLFAQLGFEPSPMHLTADLTLQLDITQDLDILMAGMRKNTRYEIRKAERVGIRVESSQDRNQIKEFYQHQLALAEKHGFVPFSYDFLKKQFDVFVNDNQVCLFHSYKDDTLLASAFVIFYGEEAVYHYGISTPENAKLPGSYACQWAAVSEAKRRGLHRYNFWGIAPKEEGDEHRFAGVSLFKRGFGGEEVAYLPAHDLPVSLLYGGVKIFEMIRAKRRHLK